MKTTALHSYEELENLAGRSERFFLLIYKGGAEQSECARKRIAGLAAGKTPSVYTVDVSQAGDIHGRIGVDTAPSLVLFKGSKVVNIIKGCQTEAAYDSILAGRELGAQGESDPKKPKQVIVYTTPTCSWCTTLKTYLDSQQVPYREINVAADTGAAEAMVRKSGQQGVPQTEINGNMVVGFDKPRINQLLEIK